MANKTVSWTKNNKLDAFGPSPSTKWQSFNWTASGVGPGNGTWGMKSAACQATSPILKSLFRTLTNTSQNIGISCPASSVFRNVNHVHVHSIFASYSNTIKNLTDGSGYFYIYPSPTINEENQLIPSYSSNPVAGDVALNYTSNAVAITSWSTANP